MYKVNKCTCYISLPLLLVLQEDFAESLPEEFLAFDVTGPGQVGAGADQVAEDAVLLLLGNILQQDDDQIVAFLLRQSMLRQVQLVLAPIALHVGLR